MELPISFKGKTFTFKQPSGNTVLVHEPSGAEEELLSMANPAESGQVENVSNYIAAITDHDAALDKKPDAKEVAKWKLRDRYYFMLMTRILFYGAELKFKHIFPGDDSMTEHEFIEDLNTYVLPDAQNRANLLHPTACKPYSNLNDAYVEFQEGGYDFRFQHLTGELEQASIVSKKESASEQSRNNMLIARKLEAKVGQAWQPVTFFNNFPATLVTKLRAKVLEMDAEFNPITALRSPDGRFAGVQSIFTLSSFFYPEEAM